MYHFRHNTIHSQFSLARSAVAEPAIVGDENRLAWFLIMWLRVDLESSCCVGYGGLLALCLCMSVYLSVCMYVCMPVCVGGRAGQEYFVLKYICT